MRLSLTLSGLLLSACASLTPQPGSESSSLAMRLDAADRALREARLLDAEIAYRALSHDHPNLPDVWLRLGNIHVRQNQLDAAVHSYQQGLQRAPQDGRLWHNLALVRVRQSLDTLETASSVLPADAEIQARIQQLHHRLLQLAEPTVGTGTAP